MAREGKKSPLTTDGGFFGRMVGGLRYAILGDTSWFGPGAPPEPVAPPETEGRAWDYPTHYNLHSRPRQHEPVSFEDLRSLSDSYDLLRLAIETRKDQLSKLSYSVGFRMQPGDQLRRKPDERCAQLEEFFRRPDRRHGWSTWLRMLLEDVFVIDAPAIYVRRNMAGGIYSLEVIDGATIKVVLNEDGRTPAPPDPAYQQYLKGLPAVNYTTEELIYFPRNPRAHKAYGFSPVEQIVMTINIALRRQIHQLQHYTEGNVPEAIAGVPEEWTPEQIQQFQAYWDSLLEGDTAQRRHMKFVPGKLSLQFTKDPMLKDEFDEWLARVVCYAFSLPPFPFVKEQNRATAMTAREAALDEGLAPLMSWTKDLMDHIIQDHFGYHDLEFMWADEESMDPATKSAVDLNEIRIGLKSIDEVRVENGDDPIGMGHAIFGAGPLGVIFIEDINTPEKREALMQKMQGGPEGLMGDPLGQLSPEQLKAMGVESDDPVVLDAIGTPRHPPPPIDPNDPVVQQAIGGDGEIGEEDLAGLSEPPVPVSAPQEMEPGDTPPDQGLREFAQRYLNNPPPPPPPPIVNDPVIEGALHEAGKPGGQQAASAGDPVQQAITNPPSMPEHGDPKQDPVVLEALAGALQRRLKQELMDPVVLEALRRQPPVRTKDDPAVQFRLGFNKWQGSDYP